MHSEGTFDQTLLGSSGISSYDLLLKVDVVLDEYLLSYHGLIAGQLAGLSLGPHDDFSVTELGLKVVVAGLILPLGLIDAQYRVETSGLVDHMSQGEI